MRAWERNAANLAASLSFYGPVTALPGLHLITCWVPHPVFNIALLDGPAPDPEGFEPSALDLRIEAAAAHYRVAGHSWSFWVCEDLLGPRTSRRLMRIFDAHGLHCIAEPPGMEAEELPAPRRELPDLDVRPLDTAPARADFAAIVSQCFHIPTPVARRIYEEPARWQAPLEIYVGYAGGAPAATAAFLAAAGALGIYSVATLPHLRGRGYAEAIMRHGVGLLRARGAAGPLVLQSSPGGLDLYRRLGFRRTTRYFVFST